MSTLNYIRTGDYYVPNLTIPNEKRAIGKYGYIYCEYLKQQHPIQYSQLSLNGLL